MRISESVKWTLHLARQEAQGFGHESLGTEHILLGLIRDSVGVAVDLLEELGIGPDRIRMAIERIVEKGPPAVTTQLVPFTPGTKKVLDLSIEEADNCGHDCVGSGHLLLGLIREGEGIAAQVLADLGIKIEDVREKVLDLAAVDTVEEEEHDVPLGRLRMGEHLGQGEPSTQGYMLTPGVVGLALTIGVPLGALCVRLLDLEDAGIDVQLLVIVPCVIGCGYFLGSTWLRMRRIK